MFAWNGAEQRNFNLWLKLAGPGEPIRLTSGPADDLSPAWSPDGRSIAFIRIMDREFSPSEIGIFIKPALGGAEHLVHTFYTHRAVIDYTSRILTWTPDGHRLVVEGTEISGHPQELRMVDPATGDSHPLTHPSDGARTDFGAAVRPDGTAVAFVRARGSGVNEIFLLPLRGDAPAGQPRQITFERQMNGSPAWTPDGSALLFSRGHHLGPRFIQRVSIARDLTPSPASVEPYGEGATTLAISRQGQLVYARAVRNASIWRLNLNSETAPAPFISSTMDGHTPAYSPDGHRIAFASTRSGAEEIWLANSDGSNLTQLTQMNGPKTANPQFAPDGRQLVFDSQKEGLSDLYLIDLASGDLKRLTSGPSNKIQARWSRDGRYLYYSSDAGGKFQIWKMSSEGGRASRISEMWAYRAEESCDGKILYLAQHTSLWSLALRDNADGKPVRLLDDLSYSLNFAVTQRGIYYLSLPNSGHSALKFFDPATRVGRAVQDVDKRWWFGLALSPDERSLLYSVRDADGSDLVMVQGIR